MRMNRSWHTSVGTALIALATLTPRANAQSFEVVPPTSENVAAGFFGNTIPLGVGTGGTYQALYMPSQLVGLPIGGQITSLQLRLYNFATAPWPASAGTIANYRISFGGSNLTADTLSTTFADNITNPVLVRSGSFSLDAGAYPGGAASGTTPEAWGPVITFSTPYTYNGGPLVIEVRSTGIGGSTEFADATPSTSISKSVFATSSDAATTGAIGNSPIVMRLGITPPNTQAVTLPNANDTVAGVTGNYIPFAGSTGGRQLTLYAADQLASIPPGSVITGLQLRQRNAETVSWPPSDFVCSDYEIWLSQSSLTPATASTTFANNLLNSVMVRDGARTSVANEYPGGAATGTTPGGWGPIIPFDTPYVYMGGVLGVEYRNTGGGSPLHFADVVSNSATAAGLASTASPTNPTGTFNGAVIVRLAYVPPVTSPFGDGVTKIYALKDYAGTPAPSQQSVLSLNVSYASEFVYAPEQFQTVGPGTLLTALALRKNDTAPWPVAPTTATSYSIDLSRSLNGPATLSTTVANNVGPDNTTVRSGSLSVLAGEMAAATPGGTAPFTWQIPFSTPYSYRSGSLLGVFRNTGFASSGDVDAIAFNAPEIGVQTKGFFSNPSNTATTTFVANVPVMRFSADAQVMAPNSLKDGVGFASGFSTPAPFASAASTFQNIVSASELAYIPVGGLITSVEFFNSNNAAWPEAAGAVAGAYQITISTSTNRPATASQTFAANQGADALIVRSGPISWLPGSLPASATGLPGGRITFDRAFVYTGGDLCITFRHDGVTNGNPSLRSAGTTQNNRAIRNPGQLAESGVFFGSNTGAAMRLGYIPTDITPRSARNSDGTAGSRFIFAGTRAYQMLYNADQVGVPVGATINGVSFRIDNEAPAAAFFPAADFTNDRFDITMSTAINSAATMSTTFANNEGSDITTVRSGPIAIPKGAYPAFTPQRPFGLFIPFTRPFVYKGGPLTMLIRSGTASGATTDVLFDSTNAGAAGVRNIGDANALSGSPNTGGIVARFAFTDDAFCPADLNTDGVVDDLDFQIFVLSYNILDCTDAGMALGCPGDFNFDRIVNDDDFLPFVQAYNAVLCP